MEFWFDLREAGFQALGWTTAAWWGPTQCQPWSQALHLDLTLKTIFKIAFSRYKWRCKGSKVKKLAKSIFIIWSSKHSYLTLGWPCNLLPKVRALLRVKRDIVNNYTGTVGIKQSSRGHAAMCDHPVLFWAWPADDIPPHISKEFFLRTEEKRVSPGFVNRHDPSPPLSLCVDFPFGSPVWPTSSSLLQLFKKKKKTTIRSFKCIFFKCKVTVYWSPGENNILSTNRTEWNGRKEQRGLII